MPSLLKIATTGPEGTMKFVYPNHFALQQFSGISRLVVGPSADHVNLAQTLIDYLEEPFRLTYVLAEPIPSETHPMGRYERAVALTRVEVKAFLDRFRDFFESDARHHLWIGGRNGMVVYDQHDVLFLYGPLLDFEQVLLAEGLTPGPVDFPFPHTHYYHAELDGEMKKLLSEGEWKWSPMDDFQDVYR